MRILMLSYERNSDIERDHEVLYMDRKSLDPNWQHLIDNFQPQVLFEREYNDGVAIYDDIVDYTKSKYPQCKTAVWLIDTHVSHDRHIAYALHFDYVFLAISKFVDEFASQVNENTFWLPVCWPDNEGAITPNYSPLKHEIVFVGNYERLKQWFPERAEYIYFLQNHYKERFFATTDYENMRSIIKTAKVSFNYCIKDDMNFRIFESLGLGTEVVTNDVTDIHKIDGLTDRLSIYRDRIDLVRIIDSILENKLTTNTLEAQKWIKEKHTLYQRHKAMLRMILSGQQESF